MSVLHAVDSLQYLCLCRNNRKMAFFERSAELATNRGMFSSPMRHYDGRCCRLMLRHHIHTLCRLVSGFCCASLEGEDLEGETMCLFVL